MDDYVFDVWLVAPFERTGTSMDGTARFTWRAEFARVCRIGLPHFASQAEAQAAAVSLSAANEPF